ncbi:thioesterase family protein [Rubellimicrobium sp. CFH 75288]|uniref:thioesterase family protein n=1 Tax=Rubellimicrobium sp. CFH 75288 TaxID=2697034 RepID=UPI001412DB92|nr:acyl-CoA thioesterase [Rubellimicrobium sp. CFH 75288]NAZ37463.1 thioeseterase [Rubellimicrobium sp. CFH 75288]
MYPVLRLAWQLWRHRNDPPLPPEGVHESRHLCWPWDLDIWNELNNGRTLTLYDLGRLPWIRRVGLVGAMRRNGWGAAVAGASVRYRRRVRAFDRLRMRTRGIGWDARFFYVEQAIFLRSGECAGHVLLRVATTGRGGIVAPARVMAALGRDGTSPPLPPWVSAWIAAEETRPWPPFADAP